jgi:hypothetical protein
MISSDLEKVSDVLPNLGEMSLISTTGYQQAIDQTPTTKSLNESIANL